VDPFFLTGMVIMYLFTKGKVESAAYKAGKEPPSVAKARLRHARGGGARTDSGRPKGPGAFRLLLASRWANACLAAKQRADHKAARRRAWYDEIAPLKDEQWREKQQRRLDRADVARRKWAERRGLIDLNEYRERKRENQAWDENERRNAEDDAWDENRRRDAATTRTRTAGDTGAVTGTRPNVAKPDAVSDRAVRPRPRRSESTPSDEDPLRPLSLEAERSPTSEDIVHHSNRYVVDESGSGPGVARTFHKPQPELGEPTAMCRIEASSNKPLPDEDTIFPRNGEAFEEYLARLSAIGWKWKRVDPNNPFHLRITPADMPEQPQAEQPQSEESQRDEPNTQDAGEPGEAVPARSGSAATPAAAAVRGSTEGTSTVYEQAVANLIRRADEVAHFRANLATFADTLAGKKWGVEVTGPIKDMNTGLSELEGTYRDLAAQMRAQGDRGAEAYDKAPWVPGPEAVGV
jgi:hypothetical protein